MLKNTSSKINRGFSLIEVLLVIAIIGVISVLSINTLQIKEQYIKEKKIATKIQQIFSAANTYYSNYDIWPDPNDVVSDQEFRSKYFTQDPFAAGCSVVTKEVCYHYSTIKDDSTKQQLRFQVIAEVTNKNKAEQIANMLPYASVSAAQITTEISLPTRYIDKLSLAHQGFGGGGLIQVVDTDARYSSFKFNDSGQANNISIGNLSCPVGKSLSLMVLPLKFNVGSYSTSPPHSWQNSFFANVPALQFKTTGVHINDLQVNSDGIDCNDQTGTCSFTYDFQGTLLDSLVFDMGTGKMNTALSFPHALSGYKGFSIDYAGDTTGTGSWSNGSVFLNYLVLCK